MDQTLAIRRTGEIGREQIVKMQEAVNRRALLIRRSGTTLLAVLNLAVPLFMLLPFLYAASAVFMPSSELFTTETNLVLKTPTFENLRQVLVEMPLTRFMFNSFLVAGLIALGQIISCSLTALSFSFLESKGKETLFMLVMATMMIPGGATIISNYLTVNSSNWLDPHQMLIVPYFTSAMGIFLLRQFYRSFPISLYESAGIDECTNLRFIFRILPPLTKPTTGAMTVYTLINAWNTYMWPMLVTGSNEMYTVQIGISMLNNEDIQSIISMVAEVVLVIIPSIAIFIVGQKQPIRGILLGAAEG